ncbi:MAG: penicillin-binding protein 2 [Pseudomonadota bacterium]
MFDDRGEIDQHARFNRRALLLFAAQFGVASVLAGRLYQLQLVESAEYATLAEENRIKPEPVAPERGAILDRSGLPLAVNRPNYRIDIIREQTNSMEETIARLRRLMDLSDWELGRFEQKLRRKRAFETVTLKENLDWDAFARVNANAPALPGVYPSAGWVRDYPERDALAHVIGYVAAVTQREIDADPTSDPLLRLPDARIGKNGVERAVEDALRGSAGERRVEITAGGREIRELSRDPGRPGEELELTIDRGLQRYAMERVKGESAAVVLMDIQNGDLLAIASAPAFDPNKFVFGISHDDWNALRDDEYDPLRSKAVAGAYPPGSTFKMITAIAALHEGAITPNETIYCSGRMRLGDRFFHCWKRQGHGPMRLKTAIQKSCDVYFYEAAKRVGVRKLAEMAAAFGVGERPEIEIPNVKRGNLPTPEWMRAERGRGWSGGDTLNIGIGQGALLMTPLQMAVMTARLANRQWKVTPRLIRRRAGVLADEPRFEPLGVDTAHIDLTLDAMNAVSNEQGGTAFRSRIDDPVNQLAGKTGTAQVRRITEAERATGVRKNEDLPWRLRDHALFVAYAPLDKPRYAIAVVVEHGGSGSKAAAPVARDVLMRALWNGEPPLDAYPPGAPRREEEARRAERQAAQALWGADDLGRPLGAFEPTDG